MKILENKSKIMKRVILTFTFLILYLITSIPVGLFLYTLKSDMGINIFQKTGFHGYVDCLEQQYKLINE